MSEKYKFRDTLCQALSMKLQNIQLTLKLNMKFVGTTIELDDKTVKYDEIKEETLVNQSWFQEWYYGKKTEE